MRYTQLTKLGESYGFEVGGSGVRTNHIVWQGIENKLRQAILDLRNLSNASSLATSASSSKSVKDLVKFHEAKQSAHAQGVNNKAEINQAKQKVEYYRRWLQLEGATADQDGNIIMTNMGNLKVYYDNTLQKQGLTRIFFNSGLMYTDIARTKLLSTRNCVTHFSGPGKAIYVMSQSGNLHVASHVVGHYHHSSLLAGQPVACAGELEVDQGRLLWLSNKSGHYCPNLNHLVQILHQLQKNGVATSFRLSVHFPSGRKDFNTVGEFLQKLELDGEPDYELNKLLAYSAHLKDSVLNNNGWRWRKETNEAPGVYDVNTNNPIPHKTVRTWLKSQGFAPAFDYQSGSGR